MALEITHTDDSPLTGLSLTVERAVPSTRIPLKIKNTGTVAVVGAFVTLYAETTPGSGVYGSSDQPVVDERMGRLEITGQDSSATPGQEVVLGVVQPMGHLAVALLPTIEPGDWILADFWLVQGGSSAGGGSINIKLEVANERLAYPLPIGVSKVGTGVDSGVKQARSYLIDGREVTATGSPDDEIHVAAGSWLIEGEVYVDATIEDLPFDQNDAAPAALTAGQSYIAAVTQGTDAVPTVTKGLAATTPDKPTPPAGELILAWVTVNYNVGTTVVQDSDIESDPVFGRYLVTAPATGLTATVHTGEAIIADFAQVHAAKEDVGLSATSTNRIWLEWNGALTVTQSDIPPSAGAVMLAIAETNGSAVVDLTDTRTYIRALNAGSSTLRVKAVGGSPDVTDVVEIDFPDLSVTDLGAGVVEIGFPSITNAILKTGLVTFTGDQSMGSHKLTNVTDPTSAQDAATKAYVDGITGGGPLTYKSPVRVATTIPGTLATSFENGDVVDGVTLATGDRILIKNQSTGSANGIYTVNASGSPTRATDADSSAEMKPGTIVFVEEGTVNKDTGWQLTTNSPITLGSTALTFQQFTASPGSIANGAETLTFAAGTYNDVVTINTSANFNATKISTPGAVTITGFAAPLFGQVLMLISISAANVITLKHNSLSSASGNRIVCPGAVDYLLDTQGKAVFLYYDLESLTWRLVAINTATGSGASLTVTDGITTVTGVIEIDVTGGGVVNDLTGGVAEIDLSGLGGGGGGSTSTGAEASRPAAGNNGNLYFPNDGNWIERDNGATWDQWGPIFPVGGIPSFAWRNQGSATAQLIHGGEELTVPAVNGYNLRIREVNAPGSTPWTLTAAFLGTLPDQQWNKLGICMIESGSGKIITWGYPHDHSNNLDGSLYGFSWNSVTSFNNSLASRLMNNVKAQCGHSGQIWLRIVNDGVNESFQVGGDGRNFTEIASQATGSFLTTDKLGYFCYVNHNGGKTGYATLISWKVT